MADSLAQLLEQAKGDPSLRPEFYRALWEADLYFVGVEGALSYYEAQGRTLLPCFSSEELFRSVVPEQESSVVCSVQAAFPSIPPEITVVLNPFTTYGKEFDSLERRALEEGMLFEQPARQEEEAIGATDVLFGQSKEPQEELVAALQAFCEGQTAIEAVYLGQVCIPSTGVPPHPLVGVIWSGSEERAFWEMALDLQKHVQAVLEQELRIDVYPLAQDDMGEIARYLLEQTQPIYTVDETYRNPIG